MGRVAEVVRWTCDACGVEGDGVGETLPKGWSGASRWDNSFLLIFCPQCGEKFSDLLRIRGDLYQKLLEVEKTIMMKDRCSRDNEHGPLMKLIYTHAEVRAYSDILPIPRKDSLDA